MLPSRKPREVSEEPTGDVQVRIITITGSPSSAQMAQYLISQKLQSVSTSVYVFCNPDIMVFYVY